MLKLLPSSPCQESLHSLTVQSLDFGTPDDMNLFLYYQLEYGGLPFSLGSGTEASLVPIAKSLETEAMGEKPLICE